MSPIGGWWDTAPHPIAHRDETIVSQPKMSDTKPKPPRSARVKRDLLEEIVDEHLASRGCTLYSRAFDIGPGGSRPDAVQFFADFFEEINARLG